MTASQPDAFTIDEFRRRHRISPDAWRAMVAAGEAPRIHRGERGRSLIAREAERAWFDRRASRMLRAEEASGVE